MTFVIFYEMYIIVHKNNGDNWTHYNDQNKAQQSNLKKGMIVEANINEVDYLADKVS
jgi:hypothetical protein